MIKELPIVIDTDVMSECWTYCKMAVIQTSPHYLEWLSSHMNIFMKDYLRANFGMNGERHPMNYFNDILAIHEKDIQTLNPENIVSSIIYEIDKGRHVVIYLNRYALWNGKNDYFDLHESVIYGYDTEKQLFLVSYIQNGRFGKNKISYERLVHAFADALKYYKENPRELFRRRDWLYPFTSMHLRSDYHEDNAIYYFLRKLVNEANGVKSKNIRYDQNLEKAEDALPYSGLAYEDEYYYSGLACLIGMEEIISNILSKTSEPEEWVTQRLSHSLFTLYEHCNIIKKSMEWVIDKLELDDEISKDALLRYGKCCEQMQMLCMLGYKVRQTNDVNGLHRIKDYMREQYISEKKALLDFERATRKRYTEIMLSKIQI